MRNEEKKIGINIGTSKDAIAEARGAINDILAAEVQESTKCCALETLKHLAESKNIGVSGCNVNLGADRS